MMRKDEIRRGKRRIKGGIREKMEVKAVKNEVNKRRNEKSDEEKEEREEGSKE